MVTSKLRSFRTACLAVLAAGCGALLGISPPDHDDAENTGGAAAGGRAGHGEGGAGEGATDQGGNSGGLAGAEPGRGGAAPTGGRATGGGETAGDGGAAADAGAGGEPPEESWPRLGAACSIAGGLACSAPRSPSRFLCSDGVWIETDSCGSGDNYQELCDRTTGTCGLQQSLCDEPGPIPLLGCSAGQSAVCGPDLVTLTWETCLFGCVEATGACDGPAPGDLLIDRPARLRTRSGVWPNPIIPVCWREPDDADSGLRAAIRERIDTTWGRFSSVGFSGWGACGTEATGVALRLVDDCDGELARLPHLGYPGPSATLPVDICTSYVDTDGTHAVNAELLRFVALHVFGHVLGLEDLRLERDVIRVMERVVELSTYARNTLNEQDINVLEQLYGTKPSHSLVGPDGRCLSFAAGTLGSAPCDGSAAQRWRPGPAELLHVESGACVRAASGAADSVELAPCSGDAAREGFGAERVRWQVSHGRCAAVRANAQNGNSPLAVTRCDPGWPSAQAFHFEFLGGGQVRIHTSDGRCVTWPSVWNFPSLPALGGCGGADAVFEAADGKLGVAGHCLVPVFGTTLGLEFRACTGDVPQHFALSGAFELGANALALPTSDPPSLRTTPLGGAPSPTQIFDYHF